MWLADFLWNGIGFAIEIGERFGEWVSDERHPLRLIVAVVLIALLCSLDWVD